VPGDGRISVVVITYNRCDELDRTLQRLAELPEQPPVIVVDNASTDGTAEMVRSRHPGVALLTPNANLSAVGRNLGVEAARTPYVAFCDDDTWYEPGSLAYRSSPTGGSTRSAWRWPTPRWTGRPPDNPPRGVETAIRIRESG
jgi:glycosyltransferase involved in cell wall biosynthesis